MINVTIPAPLVTKSKEARLLMYDKVMKYFLMWFGGHGVHVYNEKGVEVAFWNSGDFRDNDADEQVVKKSMQDRINNLNYIDFS